MECVPSGHDKMRCEGDDRRGYMTSRNTEHPRKMGLLLKKMVSRLLLTDGRRFSGICDGFRGWSVCQVYIWCGLALSLGCRILRYCHFHVCGVGIGSSIARALRDLSSSNLDLWRLHCWRKGVSTDLGEINSGWEESKLRQ